MGTPSGIAQPVTENAVLAEVLHRWQQLRAGGLSARALTGFHADHKYLLMAHSVPAYQQAGRLLGQLAGRDLTLVASAYVAILEQALATPATREGHVNVLQHIAGYFRGRLSSGEREALQAAIAGYAAGDVLLADVIARINRCLATCPDDYLARQVYLQRSWPRPGNQE